MFHSMVFFLFSTDGAALMLMQTWHLWRFLKRVPFCSIAINARDPKHETTLPDLII